MNEQLVPRDEASLGRRASSATLKFLIFLAVLIFLPAGSLFYVRGWLLWAHIAFWCVAVTWYLFRHDQALLERRMAGPGQEKEIEQRRIQAFTSVLVIAIVVVPALDYRFGWSLVPSAIVVFGHILVAIGFAIVLLVFRENSFASSTIGVAEDQRVISTGLYGWVRHPMYFGAVILLIGVPLSLGSWVGLLVVVPLVACLVARLRHEEHYLSRNLPGYDDYRRSVGSRLLPRVW